jgi:hypothetical protein
MRTGFAEEAAGAEAGADPGMAGFADAGAGCRDGVADFAGAEAAWGAGSRAQTSAAVLVTASTGIRKRERMTALH